MKTYRGGSFLAGIPSWGLALITMFLVFFVLMALPDRLAESATGEALAYIILGLVNGICCYFIVKQNPKSFWYVPLIINAFLIISAFTEHMNLKDWLFLCGMWVLSIIASIFGMLIGKRRTISNQSRNPNNLL